tara:strand:+ start:1800 stop:2225 length:426 start_codon:yes stop_codon:yes gene_type:complete
MRNFIPFIAIFLASVVAVVMARSLTWEQNHPSVGICTGECYEKYQIERGIQEEKEAKMLAIASPADLGKRIFGGCAACHGVQGEGLVGPKLQGQESEAIVSMLQEYKNGITRGSMSNLMWGQAAALSDNDIINIAAYVESL